MAARRCTACNLNWPDFAMLFAKCGKCQQATSRVTSAEPMSEAEASALVKAFAFERFLEMESPEDRRKRRERHEGLPAPVDVLAEDIVTRAIAAARKRQREVNDLNKNWRESNG